MQPAVQLPCAVDGPERLRRPLGGFHVKAVYPSRKPVAAQGIWIQHHTVMSPRLQLLPDGLPCGIVTAAGAAGKYQCIHNSPTPIFSLVSLLERSFPQTVSVMTMKPATMLLPCPEQRMQASAHR